MTVNENGTLYELDSVYANEGGVLYELDPVYMNEGGVLYLSDTNIKLNWTDSRNALSFEQDGRYTIITPNQSAEKRNAVAAAGFKLTSPKRIRITCYSDTGGKQASNVDGTISLAAAQNDSIFEFSIPYSAEGEQTFETDLTAAAVYQIVIKFGDVPVKWLKIKCEFTAI